MTVTATWGRVQGDVNDTLVARFGGVADLIGVTSIVGRVWKKGEAATVLDATVLDEDERTFTVQLGTWLATASGVYFFEAEATWPGGSVTSPEKTPSFVSVRAQGG